MREKIITFLKDEKGQGITEYVILLTLVALVALFALRVFPEPLKKFFDHLVGNDPSTKYGLSKPWP
jgi:Flp pilus assembly pilin Flp